MFEENSIHIFLELHAIADGLKTKVPTIAVISGFFVDET